MPGRQACLDFAAGRGKRTAALVALACALGVGARPAAVRSSPDDTTSVAWRVGGPATPRLESVAPVLDILEPGDLVLVTYVRVNDQLQAQRIVKAPDASQRQ